MSQQTQFTKYHNGNVMWAYRSRETAYFASQHKRQWLAIVYFFIQTGNGPKTWFIKLISRIGCDIHCLQSEVLEWKSLMILRF